MVSDLLTPRPRAHVVPRAPRVTPEAIRAKRKELGLSQNNLAHLLGTKQSNISVYESRGCDSHSVVEDRFRRFLELDSESAYAQVREANSNISYINNTLASLAGELQDYLAHNPGQVGMLPHAQDRDYSLEIDVLRFVIGMNDEYQYLKKPSDQLFFLQDPGTSGNAEVDALLAGMAIHWSRESNLIRVPAWTRTRIRRSAPMWFLGIPSGDTTLHRSAIASGIPALRPLGIFIDRRNLESL